MAAKKKIKIKEIHKTLPSVANHKLKIKFEQEKSVLFHKFEKIKDSREQFFSFSALLCFVFFFFFC
jgi:hypothetical protein